MEREIWSSCYHWHRRHQSSCWFTSSSSSSIAYHYRVSCMYIYIYAHTHVTRVFYLQTISSISWKFESFLFIYVCDTTTLLQCCMRTLHCENPLRIVGLFGWSCKVLCWIFRECFQLLFRRVKKKGSIDFKSSFHWKWASELSGLIRLFFFVAPSRPPHPLCKKILIIFYHFWRGFLYIYIVIFLIWKLISPLVTSVPFDFWKFEVIFGVFFLFTPSVLFLSSSSLASFFFFFSASSFYVVSSVKFNNYTLFFCKNGWRLRRL